MALVSLNRIKTWYTHTSWVYQSFAYLFKNPLYDKPLPQMAAVCALFWMAIFSIVIFRPFVYLVLAVRWLCRHLHLNDALRWTDRKFDMGGSLGVSTIKGCLMCALILFFASLVAISEYMIWSDTARDGLFIATLLGHLWFACFIVCVCLENKLSTRGVIWILTAITSTLFAIAATVYPEAFAWSMLGALDIALSVFGSVGSCIYLLFASTGWGIWDMIVTLIDNWVASLSVIGVLALSGWLSFRFETSRSYLTIRYLDARLWTIRKKVLAEIANRIDIELYDASSHYQGCRWWKNRVIKSFAAQCLVADMVDSLSWLTIDFERFNLSVSNERMKQIENAVLAEWREEMADEKMMARAQAIGDFLAADWAKFTTTRTHRVIAWIARQTLTFVSVVWELLKAYKTKACPLLPLQHPPVNVEP